jgi:hypothetical protein
MCQKNGSKDEKIAWAKARLLFVTQLKFQFDLGKKIDKGETTWNDCDKKLPPMWIHGILQVDECHNKCAIGGSGHGGSSANVQYRIAIDSET